MSQGRKWDKLGLTLGAFAVAGVLAAPAAQAQEEAPAINNGKVSFSVSTDVASAYWFRGIAQENQGLIVQPGADVSFAVYSDDTFTVDAYAGVWNSWHFNGPSGTSSDGFWYEADFFMGASVGLPGGFALDLSYINLYGPSAGGEFAEEIDLGISYDDSELWGDMFGGGFALSPYALFAFEIDAGSDGLGKAGDKGIYLELGVEPSFSVVESETYPVSIAVPLTVGLNLDSYYETASGAKDDKFFGFFQVGVVASTPLSFIPAEYGEWGASLGWYGIFLGDSTKEIGNVDFGVTNDDSFQHWISLGVSMSY